MSPPISVESTIRAINPRRDKEFVLEQIGRLLDYCDPSERPAIQFTRWPETADA